MATVEIRELIKPETGEKFYPYAHLNGVKGAELLPRIGGSVQTTLPTPIFQIKDALNAQFYPQTHAEAVIGLAQAIESNQFFEKESDGNGGYRVKLKDEFTGFYANGWAAAGGVGTGGGGGGGGLISTVYGESYLGTIYSAGGSESLTATFSAFAIDKVWQAVVALQQATPNVSLSNGSAYSTLTVNGTVADFYTKVQVDGLISGIHSFEPVPVQALPTASADTMYKLYLVPSDDPQSQNIKDEYITYRTGSAGNYSYSWEKVGSTAIDLTGYATESWVNQQGFLKAETDPTVPAWAKASTKPSYAFSEITNKPTTVSGYGITDAVNISGDQSIDGNKTFTNTIFAHYIMGASASTPLVIGNPLNVSYVKIVEDTTMYDRAIRGIQVVSDTPYVKWEIAENGAASFALLSVGGVSVTPANYVTLTDAQTISGLKTFTNSLYGKTVASNTDPNWYIDNDGSASFDNLQVGGTGVVTIANAQEITGAKTFSGGIVMNGTDIIPSADLGSQLGYSNRRFSNLNVRTIGSVKEINFKDSNNSATTGALSFANGWMILRVGANIASSYKQIIFHETYGLYPENGSSVNLGYYSSTDNRFRWANIYGVNEDLSGNLNVGGTISVNSINSIDQSNSGMSLFNYGARATKSFDAYGTSVTLRAHNAQGTQINLLGVTAYGIVVNSTIRPNDIAGLNLGANNANGRWANIYGVNADLSGDLSLAQTSHIDIGPLRIEYDATNKALHITKKDGNDTNTYGLYADGFGAAGGVGEGGGGGYGVEQITTNEDGTIDFHFTGGDITTVDLNHEHPQYMKHVECDSQSEYNAITTKDSGTIYTIGVGPSKVYIGTALIYQES